MKMLQMKTVALAITLISVFGNAQAVDWFGKQGKKDKKLFDAVSAGDSRGVESAIKDGANVNAIINIKRGKTLLMDAVQRPNSEIVKILINAGANVNAADNSGWTPLLDAIPYVNDVQFQYQDIVGILINEDANVNATTRDGRTPLQLAKGLRGNTAIEKMLIMAGAK